MEAQWGQEQYELCEAYMDYLGAVQLYNKYHAKYRRRLAPWLQVTYCVIYIRICVWYYK